MTDHLVQERLGLNQSKEAAKFRDVQESGIDVEYRKVRLEQVVLVFAWSNAQLTEREANYSMDELERLAITAGANVLGRVMQQRQLPDNATYLGKGKAQELANLVAELGADTVVVNETLAPSTRRTLEDLVDAKVVDRTALILDIFATHAKSKAGRAQVELAQLEYMLPRLRGWGAMMSRQAGGQAAGGAGIGSRGPGETQLEIDRRRIHTKIALLKKQIKKIKLERSVSRQKRRNSSIPSVAIVGYTNTGKSSLLNKLTAADIIIQDALFATLDTTTRKMNHPKFTITDTVGFIQDLPTALVEAFRSTLDEALDADILLHVVDATCPNPDQQIHTVNEILSDIRSVDGQGKIVLKNREQEVLVFNKIDIVELAELERLQRKYPTACFISTKTGQGIEQLLEVLYQKVVRSEKYQTIELLIDYSDGAKLAKIYRIGEVLERSDTPDGIKIQAVVSCSAQID
jgi:GTP-binding protein HflX